MLAANQIGRRRRTTSPRPLADRRSLGPGARRGRPTARASSPPTSTSSELEKIRARLPRSPTAGPRSTAAEVTPDGPPTEKRRQILDAAIVVFARQGFHNCRVSDIADEAGVAYGLVYHYFDSKDQMLERALQRALVAAARGERRGRPRPRNAAREARRGRRVHHRVLPPRPRPDEGRHRRGDPSGEQLRAHPPRRDPPGLRGDREDRRRRAVSGPVPLRRRCRLRLDALLRRDRAAPHRAGSSASSPAPTRTTSAPSCSSSRRSAPGSSRGSKPARR